MPLVSINSNKNLLISKETNPAYEPTNASRESLVRKLNTSAEIGKDYRRRSLLSPVQAQEKYDPKILSDGRGYMTPAEKTFFKLYAEAESISSMLYFEMASSSAMILPA